MDDKSIMPFGKHKGEKLGNVPSSYLLWIYDNLDLRDDLKDYIQENYQQIQDDARYEKKNSRM
jgi:hypothetical protein